MQRFREIIFSVIRGYFAHEVGKRAASLTYYLVFAIFPFLLSIFSLLGFLRLPMLSFEGEAAAFLPADIITLINLTIAHMQESSNGAILTFGMVFSLWFPFRAVKNMTCEVAAIYGGDGAAKPAGRMKRIFLLYISILLLLPLLILLLIVGENVLRLAANFLPITSQAIALWSKLRFLPMALALMALNVAVYYFSPAQSPAWRHILPGAFLATATWMLFSLLFAYYVDHIGRYSVVYGSIGAIIAFLIWLNWSVTALLLGAVFNRSLLNIARSQ